MSCNITKYPIMVIVTLRCSVKAITCNYRPKRRTCAICWDNWFVFSGHPTGKIKELKFLQGEMV